MNPHSLRLTTTAASLLASLAVLACSSKTESLREVPPTRAPAKTDKGTTTADLVLDRVP